MTCEFLRQKQLKLTNIILFNLNFKNYDSHVPRLDEMAINLSMNVLDWFFSFLSYLSNIYDDRGFLSMQEITCVLWVEKGLIYMCSFL